MKKRFLWFVDSPAFGSFLKSDVFQKTNETVLGMAADPVRRTYWVFTDQSLFELVVGNEDRDVWKIYLQKGQFEVALRYAKVCLQARYSIRF